MGREQRILPMFNHMGRVSLPRPQRSPRYVGLNQRGDQHWWHIIHSHERERQDLCKKRKKWLKQFSLGWSESQNIDGVDFNLAYAWVQSILPQVLFRNPKSKVSKRRSFFDRGNSMTDISNPLVRYAMAQQELLNFSYDCCNLQEVNRLITFRALLEGIAWSKDAWDPIDRMRSFQYVEADDIFVDSAAKHLLKDARYVIHRIVRPADEVYEDPFLDIPKTFHPNWSYTEEKEGRARRRRDQRGREDDAVKYYEVWYKPPNDDPRIFVLYAEGHKRAQDDLWPFVLAPHDWPFIPLIFNTDYNGIDGKSHLEFISTHYSALQELSTYIFRRSRKSCTDKVMYDPEKVDPAALSKLLNEQDLAPVPIQGLANMPNDPVRLLQYPMMNQDIMQARQAMRQDGDEILGFSDISRGGSGQNFETATEAEDSSEAAQTRLNYTRNQQEMFLKKQAQHGVQLQALLMDPERLAQILGPGYSTMWLTVPPDEIQYQFLVDIETGSTQEVNRQRNINEAVGLFNLALRAGESGIPNVKKTWENVIRAYDVPNPEEYTMPDAMDNPMMMAAESNALPNTQQSGQGGQVIPMPEGTTGIERLSQQGAGGIGVA